MLLRSKPSRLDFERPTSFKWLQFLRVRQQPQLKNLTCPKVVTSLEKDSVSTDFE